MNAALAIIAIILVGSTALGLYAGRRVPMTLEAWSVGGRRFGVVLVWLLMAGEVYTTFTFLGASGWAYGRGAPAFYILAYGTIAYILSFFVLPLLWRTGKEFGLHTQPDYFLVRYGSRGLAGLVALIGVISIVPYLQLQLTGLGLIVQIASAGSIAPEAAMITAFALTCAFVYASGLKGSAWVAIVKDVTMLIAVLVVGIGLPRIYFGGIGPMLAELVRTHPAHLAFPGSTTTMGTSWVISTILLSGLGFYMWPHQFPSFFSARDEDTIRRNAIIMPLYQVPILFVFFVGFAALLVIPGLKNPDTALLELVARTYPPWFLGFVGAAGALTAMVPASVLLLAAATLLAKNVYRPLVERRRRLTEAHLMGASRAMMLAIALLALLLALWAPNDLVKLLIFGYDGVCQFFPAVVLGLILRRIDVRAATSGIVSGVAVVGFLVATGRDPFLGMNAGFAAFLVNLVVTLVLALLARAPLLPAAEEQRRAA
jgi:SSS family solute:Na+ symporter